MEIVVAAGLPNVALLGFSITSCSVSVLSAVLSLTIGTTTVLLVSPAANVNVPLTAV